MPELRWILIVCGAVLLVGIYAWGRRGSRASAAEDTMLRIPDPPRQSHGAYALRDEPPASFDDAAMMQPSVDDLDQPIVADRRYRDEPFIEGAANDEDTVDVYEAAPATLTIDRDARRARIEPTLGTDIKAEPARPEYEAAAPLAEPPTDRIVAERTPASAPAPVEEPSAAPAPTLSMSSTPPPRRTERRKIIALRIATGTKRFTGAQLLEALQAEDLRHGKYDIFHRLTETHASLFSIASMVEPGTFNPEHMQDETYPGITMFAQFPGPLDAQQAFQEMLSCARRLQERLGGTLQDERSVPLTIHRVERLRQELRDFELGQARDHHPANAAPLT